MVFKFKLLFIINYYTQGYTQSYMVISKASDKKKTIGSFCFTQTVKSLSTFAINLLGGIVCYKLSKGGSEKEGIYFEKHSRAEDRHYKNTEALSLRSSEDT